MSYSPEKGAQHQAAGMSGPDVTLELERRQAEAELCPSFGGCALVQDRNQGS